MMVVVAQLGCAQAASPPSPPAPTVKAEKLASTELARDLIDGRVGVLFHVGRFRFHPAGASIGQLGRWGDIVSALGLDPLNDVDRAFVTSYQASDLNTVNVIELNVGDERVRAGFRALGGNDSSATFDLRNGPDVFVALVGKHRLVSAPTHIASKVWALGETEPLPRQEAKEAARFFAFEPYATLGSPPSWPSTLLLAQAEIEIVRGGGATVRFEAMSSSESRARADAALLTAEAKRLLAVDIGLFDLEVLSPPVFHADGRRVLMETQLLPTDVDWLIRFSGG
ncbi:MAG: hypothetical protein JNK04_06825 [Myxococcales bacterium]|nr:hypothetical protein [Myxococcales bacterium]